ncbi:MAG: asparagine synthase-related protein [Candidatus Omnitrophota bacterium]
MKQLYKKYIFFRDDDVSGLTKNLKKLLEIFISAKVPIHLSIIPDKVTNECRGFLVNNIVKQKGLIEIGQHGFSHRNYSNSEDKRSKYEFGIGRTYLQQKEDICKGKNILENYFEKKISVFTPPWHRYDRNTLRCAAEEGISYISVNHKSQITDRVSGVGTILVNINFNKLRDSGTWFIEDNREILKEICAAPEEAIGILLHHEKFTNQREFVLLKNLLSLLKNTKFIEFIPLTKAPALSKEENSISRKELFYYLTYQFVPKPLTLIKKRMNTAHKDYDYTYLGNPKILNYGENKICKNLYRMLKESVKRQLPDRNEPVGLLLSGGLDSAVILRVLRDLTDRRIYTLTGAYHKDAANLDPASRLAKQFKTIHDKLIIGPGELKRIDEIYNNGYIPQPIGDNGLLSFYLMVKKLKENCNTIFSGDGADCLFSGLNMHLLGLQRGYGSNNEYEHYKFDEMFFSKEELKLFFNQEDKVTDLTAPLKAIRSRISIQDTLKKQVIFDLNFLVKNRIDYLIYPSKICKVKLSLPFLEKNFVDFAVNVPSNYLIKGSQQKYILRKVFQDRLPREILSREKEGFTPPFKLWYETNIEFVMRQLAMSITLGIPKGYIKYLISMIPKSNRYQIAMKIWLVLNLVSWHNGLMYNGTLNNK